MLFIKRLVKKMFSVEHLKNYEVYCANEERKQKKRKRNNVIYPKTRKEKTDSNKKSFIKKLFSC